MKQGCHVMPTVVRLHMSLHNFSRPAREHFSYDHLEADIIYRIRMIFMLNCDRTVSDGRQMKRGWINSHCYKAFRSPFGSSTSEQSILEPPAVARLWSTNNPRHRVSCFRRPGRHIRWTSCLSFVFHFLSEKMTALAKATIIVVLLVVSTTGAEAVRDIRE